jgi:hypothetical protein
MKKQKREKGKKPDRDFLSPNDELTLINETAHIPDRDLLFHRKRNDLSRENPDSFGKNWGEDQEDMVKGDRDISQDTYGELEQVGHLHEPIIEQGSSDRDKIPAGKEFDGNWSEKYSDWQLLQLAEALGIPGRQRMTRHELIENIKEYQTLL